MIREEYFKIVFERLKTEPDYPFSGFPDYAVLRHGDSRKWFALMMEVPRDKLGLAGTKKLDIVNLKCDPILISSLRGETGIFPAYHMNKEKWITIFLDGTVPKNEICDLLDLSYDLTI